MDVRGELFDSLEDFVRQLVGLVELEGLSFLVDVELSFTQVRMAMLLACSEPRPIRSIADQLELSVHAAGRNIDRLVEVGIVERREDPDDRRVRLVSLSAQGLDLVDRHLEARRRALRTFIDRLPDEQVEALADALRPVLAGGSLLPRSHIPAP